MRVGVYNQFWTTLGGGERLMGAAADVLAQAGHDVELITHVPLSVSQLQDRFGLALPGVQVRATPLLPADQMGGLSAEYDLWINGSHMSVVPSAAPRSVLLVMFPFPLDLSAIGRAKRWLAHRIHRQLLVPRYAEGFFGPQELGGTRYRWTAGRGRVTIQTPWPGKPLPLRLVLGSFRPQGWAAVPVRVSAMAAGEGRGLKPEATLAKPAEAGSAARGSTALQGGLAPFATVAGGFIPRTNGTDQPGHETPAWEILQTEVRTTPGDYVTLDAVVPAAATVTGEVAVEIESPTYRPFEVGGASGEPDDFREVGVAVARVMVRHPRHYAYEALFERVVPELGRRLHGLPDDRAMRYLDTYDAICPISEFSNEWLERYWGKRGTVLYPPVDVEHYTPQTERKPIILGVGRFFKESHNKKHDEMIRTFRELLQEGLHGWELHLVGGSASEARHQRYLADCRRLAQGLPVHFHVDAPAAELKALYESASIYWHATGFGENVERKPIVFEHFGIVIVEAMAAGCVPVVIGKAGPKELVADGESGFLWTTRAEWKRRTLQVATDAALAQRLRTAAVVRTRRYGEAVFRDHLLAIVDQMGGRRGRDGAARQLPSTGRGTVTVPTDVPAAS